MHNRADNPGAEVGDTSALVTGLVLAGGAGRRVQGADKGLIQWRDKPLIAHVLARLAPQVGSVLISCNRNVATYSQLAQTVQDTRSDYQGPLAGIESAAPAIKTPFFAVCACDTPRLPLDLVNRLLTPLLATDSPHQVAFARDGTRDHYLCAVLRRDLLVSCTAYLDGGGRSVRGWYATLETLAVDFEHAQDAFTNLNHGPDTGGQTPSS